MKIFTTLEKEDMSTITETKKVKKELPQRISDALSVLRSDFEFVMSEIEDTLKEAVLERPKRKKRG